MTNSAQWGRVGENLCTVTVREGAQSCGEGPWHGLPSVRRSSSLRGAGDVARRVTPQDKKASVDNLTRQNGAAEEAVKVKKSGCEKKPVQISGK